LAPAREIRRFQRQFTFGMGQGVLEPAHQIIEAKWDFARLA